MRMNDEMYNLLKVVGTLVLPALATFYATLGKIWGLPFTSEIPATIMAVDVLLNSCLGLSSSQYYKDIATDPFKE